ncbi:UDP-glucose 6-dehydrogenase [Pleurostoma richardsiae]|uniref:UDP-glucose 6-dehydrogenase n=1 Tax=Pleurostoma richardsiae TaxID=41990 RepID=A0AA38R2M4_9PEZI|nr:UDP-glucose 6-dehydrogenase [Pleurostoma richardsiae]
MASMVSFAESPPLLRDTSSESLLTAKSQTSSTWGKAMSNEATTDTAPTSAGPSPEDSPMLKAAVLEHSERIVPSDDLDIDALPKVRNICFVGAGFVGGPTAALIAFHNPDIAVNVVDLNVDRIAAWNSAHLPIHELGLPKIVRIARDGTKEVSMFSPNASEPVVVPFRRPNLFFSTDVNPSIAAADIVFICVNTPTKMYGLGAGATADLGTLELATRSVAQHAKTGAIVVEKSTVPCGTARMISDILLQMRPETHFEVLSNPEFLAEGSAVENLMYPDRILIGSANTAAGLRAANALKNVYGAWVNAARILTVNTFSSELTKLIANAMLAQRISSINAVSALCEELGADVQEVSRALGADSRLGAKFLQSGVGFGGSCFEKDILNLAWLAKSLYLNEVAHYWTGILSINQYQRERFTRTVTRKLNNTLRGKKIAIFGFAFKDGTNDTRNSVAVHVIADMAAELPQEIAVYDPGCAVGEVEEEIRRVLKDDSHMSRVVVHSGWRETVDGASAVCILTPWDQFRGLQAGTSKVKPLSRDNLHTTLSGSIGEGALSEMDIITLEKIRVSLDEVASEDPLERLLPQPICSEDCEDCAARFLEKNSEDAVDWNAVSQMMKQPSWVFDGRNIVDAAHLREMGFRVHSIGKGVDY